MTLSARRLTAALLAGAVLAACSGRTATETTASEPTTGAESATTGAAGGTLPAATTAAPPTTSLSPVTPPAKSEVDKATWAVYREPNTLDPIYAFDYPENTVISSMCEAVVQQQPDGTIAPGLTTLTRPDDTTLVLTLRDGVTFWDGSPLTADDVVFSLERQSDPALGGFYGLAFTNVASIEATAPNQVTMKLTNPDAWLEGELSSMPGMVVSKAFAEAKGQAYGTSAGGVMCTGPFKLASWTVGDRVSVVRNEAYWGGAPKVGAIDFVGVPDEATLTAGLLSGDIDGSYIGPVAAFDQLKSSSSLTVTQGPSYASGALIVSSLKGALGDVAVRKALSDAIDRKGLIDTLYHGTAQPPRALAGPGTWGYAPEVFQKAWDALPEPKQDVEGAKAAVEAAGATGKTIVLATTNEIASIATTANVIRAAAEDIGLKVELRAVSAANYINLFVDPSAREGIDGFVTVNYPDYADPAALLATFATSEGSQNFSGYDNPKVTELFQQARGELDPAARAELVTQAQAILQDDLPWIPLVLPNTVLVTSSKLTGAPSSFVYMNAPWSATLGGV
jgi:peptide/nickel transport system substrate-binding protein